MSVAAATNAIITWAEYKAMFGETSDDEQDKYQILINQASSRIEQFCNRSLKATDYTSTAALILDGSGTAGLVVPHFPVNSITKLYVDSSRAFAASSEIASTDYVLYTKSGLITLLTSRFPALPACVKLECNAGYAATDPDWQIIQSACYELVKWMAGRFGQMGFIGMRSQTNADGMNTSWETDMPMNVKTMLEPFRGRL